jgi:hypothetical protein
MNCRLPPSHTQPAQRQFPQFLSLTLSLFLWLLCSNLLGVNQFPRGSCSVHTKATCCKLRKDKGKGKFHPKTGHEDPHEDQIYSSALSLTLALDELRGQRHASAASPSGKTRYPLYMWLGRPQGRVQKISPPPEFDPRTVQPVANRFRD